MLNKGSEVVSGVLGTCQKVSENFQGVPEALEECFREFQRGSDA